MAKCCDQSQPNGIDNISKKIVYRWPRDTEILKRMSVVQRACLFAACLAGKSCITRQLGLYGEPRYNVHFPITI